MNTWLKFLFSRKFGENMMSVFFILTFWLSLHGVTHITWNPPRQNASTAVSSLAADRVSHNADLGRRVLVGGFGVTWGPIHCLPLNYMFVVMATAWLRRTPVGSEEGVEFSFYFLNNKPIVVMSTWWNSAWSKTASWVCIVTRLSI